RQDVHGAPVGIHAAAPGATARGLGTHLQVPPEVPRHALDVAAADEPRDLLPVPPESLLVPRRGAPEERCPYPPFAHGDPSVPLDGYPQHPGDLAPHPRVGPLGPSDVE